MIENTLVKTNAGDYLLRKRTVTPSKEFPLEKVLQSDRGAYCPFSKPMTTSVAKKAVTPDKQNVTQTDTFNQPNPCGSWCPHFNLSENGETLRLNCGNGVPVNISNPEIVNEESENGGSSLTISK